MSRVLAVLGLMALLLLQACGSASPAPAVLPTFVGSSAPSVPEPNEAYPTAQAAEANTSQTVGGFTLDLQRAWRDGKQVYADVCFTLPDSSNWTVSAAHLEYGGETNSEFSESLISRQEASNGQPAQRCDELGFYVPPDADLSAAQLTIESIGAYPSSDEYCSTYMPKIQDALNQRGIAITLDCPDTNGTRAMQIASKPVGMSQEEAEQMVFSDEFYTVSGPWSFPVTFNQ